VRQSAVDDELLNDWHAIADVSGDRPSGQFRTRLLGELLSVDLTDEHAITVSRGLHGDLVRTKTRYGHLWACLGTPLKDIPSIPELEEPGRCVISGGSLKIHVSGLRAMENYFDLAHFPHVHDGYLGVAAHTEVAEYHPVVEQDVLVSRCEAYQQYQPAESLTEGTWVRYQYKVFRPLIAVLYKANGTEREKWDVVAQFVQPLDEKTCVVHSSLSYLPYGITAKKIRWFMQLITSQDKAILENQVPKELPLSGRSEVSTRADAMSVAYRRWLRDKKITYGTLRE
jgi:phenylpropionate dioxygenase-like ring-hydroxylating dioxygenase large terminal subunit